MSIEQAETLKRELTDKWVVVAGQVPELRRFASLTGRVKTVNMNCRALVEFDGQEDISWYDIDPQYLTVVDEPQVEEKAAAKTKAAAKPKAAPAKKPAGDGGGAAKSASGGSPLDQIRAGGAAKAEAPSSGVSPLDQIRSQAAGGADAPKPAAGASPLDQIRAQAGGGSSEKKEKPAPAGGSPLDQIRAQAAAPPANEEAAVTEERAAETAAVEEKPADEPAAETKSSTADLPPDASPLDIIRAQGAFKG